MDNQFGEQALSYFAEILAATLTNAMNRAGGTSVAFRVANNEKAAVSGANKAAQFRIVLLGTLRGECCLEMSDSLICELSMRVFDQSLETAAEDRNRILAETISSALNKIIDASVLPGSKFEVEVVSNNRFGDMVHIPLYGAVGDGPEIPMCLHVDSALQAGLLLAVNSQILARNQATNLQLVMDIELDVTLRFGQSKLALREVLALKSGSVIELDRDIDDPVELLFDGRVIAVGEAVVVDGNYGLRITDLRRPIVTS